ncbi:uncharacterized protein KZ484_017941 [Pholidichthys leucotaenia]
MEPQRKLVKITRIPKMKHHSTDLLQQPDCKEEEVLAVQQLWNQERNAILDQEEPEPPQVKEEQEELCIGQEGELLIVKVEADTFMVTPSYEENDYNDVKPNSELLLSHNSAVTNIKNEEENRHVDSRAIKQEEEEPEPKKGHFTSRSYSNSDDNSLISKTHCGNETGKM